MYFRQVFSVSVAAGNTTSGSGITATLKNAAAAQEGGSIKDPVDTDSRWTAYANRQEYAIDGVTNHSKNLTTYTTT